MSQHNSISPQLSFILTQAHASDTFIYTPRHTRAERKVAGNVSSVYIKQLHNTLNKIHSHHARGRENLKDYQWNRFLLLFPKINKKTQGRVQLHIV